MDKPSSPPAVEAFNRDVAEHGGYLYTTNQQLSSQLAMQNSIDAVMAVCDLAGRSVVDIGCGDGFNTMRYWDLGHPRAMVGVDASSGGIQAANANRQGRPIRFEVGDAHKLPFQDDEFDLALVLMSLHHDDYPQDMIREAFRVAPEILIHEPNGNNLGLKIIEKTSKYHREHHEKSYYSWQLKRWIEEAGGRIVRHSFAGFVPMFCPDWLARTMKAVEPIVETVPLVNIFCSSVTVILARRTF